MRTQSADDETIGSVTLFRIADTLHSIFVAYSTYDYTILDAFQNRLDCPWSAKLAVLFQGFTDLLFEVK